MNLLNERINLKSKVQYCTSRTIDIIFAMSIHLSFPPTNICPAFRLVFCCGVCLFLVLSNLPPSWSLYIFLLDAFLLLAFFDNVPVEFSTTPIAHTHKGQFFGHPHAVFFCLFAYIGWWDFINHIQHIMY